MAFEWFPIFNGRYFTFRFYLALIGTFLAFFLFLISAMAFYGCKYYKKYTLKRRAQKKIDDLYIDETNNFKVDSESSVLKLKFTADL